MGTRCYYLLIKKVPRLKKHTNNIATKIAVYLCHYKVALAFCV
ncbi:hypothetical protein PTET_a1676 [Pseudoalteromonas tetraodonis]|nr:hypothetical protein PTET_a1676 [Pseudoalteromonas tetraodonis]